MKYFVYLKAYSITVFYIMEDFLKVEKPVK